MDGPASVSVISGKVEAFGLSVKNSSKIVIREGKRLPFAVSEAADFNILLGENANLEEVDGNTIPQPWAEAAEMLREFKKKPAISVVLGKGDSGKTSFCTYLTNKLLNENQNVAVLDADLGQSDIGPPCTVSYAFVTEPTTDLFRLRAENAFFVGFTSPSGAVDKTIKGIASMKQEILGKPVDFVLVNSDGWVEGEEAMNYKSRLVEELSPDVIFCLQQENELAPLIAALEKFGKIAVESPLAVRQRSRDKRKDLRELGYIKYLADAKMKTWPLKLLSIEEQNVAQIRQVGEEGLLLGLYDSQRRFLGIGVLRKIDYVRKALKVLTPVSVKPAAISFGRVRLDEKLKEIPS